MKSRFSSGITCCLNQSEIGARKVLVPAKNVATGVIMGKNRLFDLEDKI